MAQVLPTASTSSLDSIFINAQRRFLDALPLAEQRLFSFCPTSKDSLNQVKELDVIAKRKHHGIKLLKPIIKLSESLEQYFKIIDTFISSNPAIAALAWGSFRLVLQVSNQHHINTQFSSLSAYLSNSLQTPTGPFLRNSPSLSKISLALCHNMSRLFKSSARQNSID
jgi:hypothetical protein